MKKYYPDFYIKSCKKIYEAKSTWTFKKKIDCVFLKQNAAKELGLIYEIWLYNEKGDIIQKY